jgi:glutaredoxin
LHKIIVLAKSGCHLCERAVEVLQSLQKSSHKFELEVADITADDTLYKKYFLKIPVVQLDGADLLEAEDIARPDECRKKLSALVSTFSSETID